MLQVTGNIFEAYFLMLEKYWDLFKASYIISRSCRWQINYLSYLV